MPLTSDHRVVQLGKWYTASLTVEIGGCADELHLRTLCRMVCLRGIFPLYHAYHIIHVRRYHLRTYIWSVVGQKDIEDSNVVRVGIPLPETPLISGLGYHVGQKTSSVSVPPALVPARLGLRPGTSW